jgi:hypothetical protein
MGDFLVLVTEKKRPRCFLLLCCINGSATGYKSCDLSFPRRKLHAFAFIPRFFFSLTSRAAAGAPWIPSTNAGDT